MPKLTDPYPLEIRLDNRDLEAIALAADIPAKVLHRGHVANYLAQAVQEQLQTAVANFDYRAAVSERYVKLYRFPKE